MTTPARLPGAALAVGAFCLTVLLGLGTASAFGLWQQSSATTVRVQAGTWVPTVTLSCVNGHSQGSVILNITPSEAPTSLSINAKKNGQSYTLLETNLGPTATSVTLTPSTLYIASTGIGNRDVSVRVTAGFPATTTTAEWTTLRIFSAGTKISCS